jgi:hypothetical protein
VQCSSPPPAPDYVGAANATAAGNLANLEYQTNANRVNTTGPLGSTTWSQTPGTLDQAGYNSALQQWQQAGSQGPAPTQAQFTNANWSENQTLTPQEQAALSSQLQIKQNQSSLASGMQGQVASTMSQPFNAPSYSSYMSGIAPVQQNFSGFNPTGVNGVNQSSVNGAVVGTGVNGLQQNLNTNGTQVNPYAPQFNQNTANAGANAAYQAQVGMLQPQMQQDTANLDAQLRLQGLTPGTEAYNNAAQNLSRTQGQQLDQIANQSVQTGNNEANANYASTLAGYNSGNAAAGQQFNQNMGAMGANNNASTQQLANNATIYDQMLAGQQAGNTAQNQAYSQALTGYGANQSAQQAANAAQAQAFGQGVSGYNTAYNAAYQQYLQPLNSMNAVLSGNQVNVPNMSTPNTTSGYVPGADYSGATGALGSWNQGIYNAQQAANGQQTGAMAGLGSAALMAMMMSG